MATAADRAAVEAARLLIKEFGGSMVEYLRMVLESKDKASLDVADLRAAVGYAFSMREAGADDGALQVGIAIDSDVPPETDEAMIAESRRLAKLGKVRPMQEFIDERRSQ